MISSPLGNLRHVDFLRSSPLAAMRRQLLVVRARANHEFLSLISDREAANAGQLERLHVKPRHNATANGFHELIS